LGAFTSSETAQGDNRQWRDFPMVSQKRERVHDSFGDAERLTLTGKSGELEKSVAVTIYDDFPTMAAFDVEYTNHGASAISIQSWTNNAYTIDAQTSSALPAFWSYQSGSYEKRPNWIL